MLSRRINPRKTRRRRAMIPVTALLLASGLALELGTAPVGQLSATPQRSATPRPDPPQWAIATDAAGLHFVHQFGSGVGDYVAESGGSGGAWLDYDGDGHLDALLINGLPVWGDASRGNGHRLFRNSGGNSDSTSDSNSGANSGAIFSEAPASAGMRDRVWGSGATVADVDNDGFVDVLITALGPDRLYRNNGDGTFTEWPAGVEGADWSTSAAFTDWDGDGFLDLYVAKYLEFDDDEIPVPGDGACFYGIVEVFCGPEGLDGTRDRFYRNLGDGSFAPWFESGVDPNATYGFALVATDCDNDGLPEVYVANDSNINLLYRRTNDGGIEDWALFSGSGYSGDGREQAGMGVTAADYDGDGLLDLFVTNFQNDYNTLYHNLGDCNFEDATARRGLAASSFPYMGWSTHFFDADGDGDQDLFVANGHIHPQFEQAGIEPYMQRNLLYLNLLADTGSPDFVDVTETAGEGMAVIASSRGALRGDYDNDGDSDLLITNINDAAELLRNDGPIRFPALRLTLVGRTSNRSALGARVRVDSGGVSQFLELRQSDGYVGSNDTRMLVYLPGETADVVEVRWPAGSVTTLRNEGAGWLVVDEERGVIARRPW